MKSWVYYYTRLKDRIYPKHGVSVRNHPFDDANEDSYVSVGTNFWHDLKPDQWPMAEEIVIDCAQRLRALRKKQ